MNLPKAKEILELNLKEAGPKMPPDCAAALALGIEALKWRQESEEYDPSLSAFPLPGETKDYCKFCGLAHAGIECPSREGEK